MGLCMVRRVWKNMSEFSNFKNFHLKFSSSAEGAHGWPVSDYGVCVIPSLTCSRLSIGWGQCYSFGFYLLNITILWIAVVKCAIYHPWQTIIDGQTILGRYYQPMNLFVYIAYYILDDIPNSSTLLSDTWARSFSRNFYQIFNIFLKLKGVEIRSFHVTLLRIKNVIY